MVVTTENGNSVKIPKSVFWGVVVTLLITPIVWIGAKQYSLATDVVRHEEMLNSVRDNLSEVKDDMKGIGDKVDKLYRLITKRDRDEE